MSVSSTLGCRHRSLRFASHKVLTIKLIKLIGSIFIQPFQFIYHHCCDLLRHIFSHQTADQLMLSWNTLPGIFLAVSFLNTGTLVHDLPVLPCYSVGNRDTKLDTPWELDQESKPSEAESKDQKRV